MVAASLVIALPWAPFFFDKRWSLSGQGVLLFLLTIVLGAFFFFPLAGFFEWLRTRHPERLYGAEQLVRGRLLSRPAAASLLHGSLAGALVAGIHNGLSILMAMTPGYVPTMAEQLKQITAGNPLASLDYFSLVGPTVNIMTMVAIVAITEKTVRSQILRVAVASLVLTITAFLLGTLPATANFSGAAIGFLSKVLAMIVLIQVYRVWGLAAAYVAAFVPGILQMALVARAVGEPGFVYHSNLLVLAVVLLAAIGVWGYVGGRVKASLDRLVPAH